MLTLRSLRQSLSDFKRHPWLHLLSILTITLALLIVGLFFLGYRNFQHVAQGDVTKVIGTIYLNAGLNEENIEKLENQLLSLQHVQSVEFKPGASTLEDLTSFVGVKSLDFLPEGEVFPDMFEITVRSGTSSAELMTIESMLANLAGVAEVDFSQDWLMQLKQISSVLNIVGIILVVGVLVGSSFIIANFMGMRLQARKEEVDIIRLVGANKRFIVAPFLWEGLLEGILGGCLALASLYLLKVAIVTFVSSDWQTLIGANSWVFLSPSQLLGVVGIGITMAFLGSATIYLRIQDQN